MSKPTLKDRWREPVMVVPPKVYRRIHNKKMDQEYCSKPSPRTIHKHALCYVCGEFGINNNFGTCWHKKCKDKVDQASIFALDKFND